MFDSFNFIGKKSNSRGTVSLVVTLVILSLILAIALGSSYIVTSGLKTSINYSDSIAAFYAAETGVEQALFDHKDGGNPSAARCGVGPGWTIYGNAQYCLVVTQTDITDPLTITKIQSIGEYRSTRRSIEINF